MKLAELKEEVRYTWESLEDKGDGIIPQPENFLPEMRKYGDLRRKATWEKAFVRLYSAFFHRPGMEASFLVTNVFNFTPSKAFYEYRHEFFEAFLMYPDGLDLIQEGWEQLYSHTAGQPEDIDGFYRLVQEQCERGNGLAAGFAGRLPALSGAQAG